MTGDRGGCRRRRDDGRSERGAISPQEAYETVFEIAGNGYDGVQRVGPDDKDTFITLRGAKVEKRGDVKTRTMNAAFCSLSACGRRTMVSMTWMRVFAST